MSLRRLAAISKKEWKHLLRDIRLLMILLFFPVFLLVMFGYAVNFDVKSIKLAVLDKEQSALSRSFVNSLVSSGYFTYAVVLADESEIRSVLDTKGAQCVFVIPEDFSKKLFSRQNIDIQLLVDGIDGNTATIIQNYGIAAGAAYQAFLSKERLAVLAASAYVPLRFEPVFWYNRNLETTFFLIPGLIGMILVISSTVSVSLTLVREKEHGTLENIFMSPVNSAELIIGKIIPYITISLFNAAFILLMGYVLFGVGVSGSYLMLFITIFLFTLSTTSLGILISVLSGSLQIAFTAATFVSLLPSLILSGFIYQIESMPPIVQVFTNITPVKFFLVAVRAIMLRGAGFEAYWQQFIYLFIFTAVTSGIAIIRYKKKYG